MNQYYAHSGKDLSSARSDWQPLQRHLLGVAKGAEGYANEIEIRGLNLGPAGQAAGLFHDLGKYRDGFQGMIRGNPAPGRESTYHKQAGAAKAWKQKQYGVAFAIAGHHGGLPSLSDLQKAVGPGAGGLHLEQVWEEAVADCPELARCHWPPIASNDKLLFDLETRLIFSCLVDADWADTSEHDRMVNYWPTEPSAPRLTRELAEPWLENVLRFIEVRAKNCESPVVRQARDDVLQAALKSAVQAVPGFFTLEVPTGGGKTLSALAFGLKHAATFALRRIIYVAPYLSIIDQNARVIRQALGVAKDGMEVFEHHSLSDPADDAEEGNDQREAQRAALARRAENWDSPLVVTTNVQFLESLFSNQPGRCRKLHNIARSVIILDECHAIPMPLLAPTCGMLGHLVEQLRCTIVLATATQPAFNHAELQKHGSGLTNVRPIVTPKLDLFNRLRRVRVEWPQPGEYLGWDDVAQLASEKSPSERPTALCVVNTRRAARELFQAVNKRCDSGSVFHLSTWMCPAHRLEVLDVVKSRLRDNLPCMLISTQLIEAGVDVDFPLVLRELAPFDSIGQAAGRANREGTLNGADGSPGGLVVVFRSRAALDDPGRYYPHDPWYVAGRDVLQNHLLGDHQTPQIDDPETIKKYFDIFMNVNDLDPRRIRTLRERLDFPAVAHLYRLIEESGRPVVVQSWAQHHDEITKRLDAVWERPSRRRFRALLPFQVNLAFPTEKQLSLIQEGPYGLAIWHGGYESNMGLWDDLLPDQLIY